MSVEQAPRSRTAHLLNTSAQDNKHPKSPSLTPYSSFTPLQKSLIAYAASISAFFSGLSSFIYYLALTALSNSLHVSLSAINLTITSYLIVSGIAPSIFGDLTDHVGRRPVSIIALTIYLAANLGLALQSDYTALVVLRCVQSAGASSTIAIAYGVIADISTPDGRGTYTGILMGFTNVASCLGPIIGGVLTEKLSWHWIFWLLTILSGTHLMVLVAFLPEISRKHVGDGSVVPAGWTGRSIYSLVANRAQPVARTTESSRTFAFPNPLSCLIALFNKSNFLILLVGGLQYTLFGCLAASLSAQMIDLYDLNYLEGGLLYLPSGFGGIIASYLTGRLLNHDYRLIAIRHGLPISKSNGILNFPI